MKKPIFISDGFRSRDSRHGSERRDDRRSSERERSSHSRYLVRIERLFTSLVRREKTEKGHMKDHVKENRRGREKVETVENMKEMTETERDQGIKRRSTNNIRKQATYYLF